MCFQQRALSTNRGHKTLSSNRRSTNMPRMFKSILTRKGIQVLNRSLESVFRKDIMFFLKAILTFQIFRNDTQLANIWHVIFSNLTSDDAVSGCYVSHDTGFGKWASQMNPSPNNLILPQIKGFPKTYRVKRGNRYSSRIR